MMVPRSYLYQVVEERQRKRSTPGSAATLPRPRSTPPESILQKKQAESQLSVVETPIPHLPERTVSEPVSIPMLVQPRYHPTAGSPTQRTQTVKSRGQHGGRMSRRISEKHDANALPPAVAALLAITAIPPPKNLQRRRTSQQRRISIDELIQEWREGSPASSDGFKTPLDVLLEPYDEEADDDSAFQETEDEKDSVLLSSRSVSSDSIASTPSLDAARSTLSNSNFSIPSTPSFRARRNLPTRMEKMVSSPPTEACLDDHPLRSPSPAFSDIPIIQTFPPRTKRPVKQKSTFKSNLTASFSALKSAAKSFSNFTAPSIPQDDLLTRSFFSTPWPSEMRPKDVDGVPDPALRRYLNPSHAVVQVSHPDFSLQLQEALAQPTIDDNLDAPLIQMQTYSRRKRSRSRNSVGPDRGEGSVLGQTLPTIRQREPRENSNFLRVIVLEMNMRRTGKLDPKAPLRARIWLPPRKEKEREGEGREVEVRAGKEVPMRWVGILAEDL